MGLSATTTVEEASRAGEGAKTQHLLQSCLYECSVMHHRLTPKEHSFRYNIFLFYLDLDELELLSNKLPGFSHNRFNFYSFRDADHLQVNNRNEGDGSRETGRSGIARPIGLTSTRQNIIAWLAENGVMFPEDGRIMLLTLPRVLGYIFNPVSFYFCFDERDEPLCAVVQVGNTFGELKPFLLRREEMTSPEVFRRLVPKHFYVSPFFKLDLKFDFKLRIPGEKLEIHIDDRDGENRVLLTALTGRRAPLSGGRLAWFTLKYPLITLKVIFLIHWHALMLWLKKVPWHRKAANPALQTGVHNPHVSITAKSP